MDQHVLQAVDGLVLPGPVLPVLFVQLVSTFLNVEFSRVEA